MSADHTDRVINQSRAAGPQSVVQRGVVQSRNDAVKLVLLTHDCADGEGNRRSIIASALPRQSLFT